MAVFIPLKMRVESLYNSLFSHVNNMVEIRQFVAKQIQDAVPLTYFGSDSDPRLIELLRENVLLRERANELFEEEIKSAASSIQTKGIVSIGGIKGHSFAEVAMQVAGIEHSLLGPEVFLNLPHMQDVHMDLLCKHLSKSPFRIRNKPKHELAAAAAEHTMLRDGLSVEFAKLIKPLANVSKATPALIATTTLPSEQESAGPLSIIECCKVFGRKETATRSLLGKWKIERGDGGYLLPRGRLSSQQFDKAREIFKARQDSLKPRQKRPKTKK